MKLKILLSLLVCFLVGVLFGAKLWVPLLIIALAPGGWYAWRYYRTAKVPSLPARAPTQET